MLRALEAWRKGNWRFSTHALKLCAVMTGWYTFYILACNYIWKRGNRHCSRIVNGGHASKNGVVDDPILFSLSSFILHLSSLLRIQPPLFPPQMAGLHRSGQIP